MLSKINRVKKKKDFEIIFKKAKTFKDSLFIYKAVANNLKINRFGFVVNKKVSKKAIARNKIKRRMAAIIRGEIKNIRKGTDLVLIALPAAEKGEFNKMRSSIQKSLADMGVISSSGN